MARNNGLDTPRETRRSLRPNFDPEAFGRLSERFARFLGTARFLVYMTFFVMFWVVRGYGGSQENVPGDQKKYNDGKLSMIIVANIYNALIISVAKREKLMLL